MIAFIPHTNPADNIPSKNTDKNLLSPIISALGEKYTKERKNPTHVDVHNTQDINPDKKLPTPLNMASSLFPQLWILFLNPLKIDP